MNDEEKSNYIVTSINSNKKDIKESIDVINRILYKTHFETSYKNIYQDLVCVKYNKSFNIKDEQNKKQLATCKQLLNVAESLLVFKTDTNGIKISSSTESSILQIDVKKELEKILMSAYIGNGLHIRPMSYAEGEKILKSKELEKYRENYWKRYADINGFSEEDFYTWYDNECVDDEMIDFFIDNREIEEDVTPKQIESKIKDLKEEIKNYTKKGQPKKNDKIHGAILVFMKNGLECKNADFNIVFQCLDYFDLIDSKLKESWKTGNNKYPEIQYIKSLYKEVKKHYNSITINQEDIFSIKTESVNITPF